MESNQEQCKKKEKINASMIYRTEGVRLYNLMSLCMCLKEGEYLPLVTKKKQKEIETEKILELKIIYVYVDFFPYFFWDPKLENLDYCRRL